MRLRQLDIVREQQLQLAATAAAMASAVERQRQEEEATAMEQQRQADIEAARRRFDIQSAHLAAARDRTLQRLKVQPTHETFKPRASLARRKGRLAQRQGFAAALANATYQRPQPIKTATPAASTTTSLPSAPLATASASVAVVPTSKTPAKRTMPTRRQTIHLKSPIVPSTRGRADRRRTAKPSTKNNPVKASGSVELKTTAKTTKTPETASASVTDSSTPIPKLSVHSDMPWSSPAFLGFNNAEVKAGDSSESEAFRRMQRSARKTKRSKKSAPHRMSDREEEEKEEEKAEEMAEENEEDAPTTASTPITVTRPATADLVPQPISRADDIAAEAPPSPPAHTSYTSSYTSVAAPATKHSVQMRDLFGDGTMSDSDCMDTPTKQTFESDMVQEERTQQQQQQHFSDVMPTPQKTSTPNELEQQKRNALAHAPVGAAAARITFAQPSNNGHGPDCTGQPQSAIKLPAKKRKTAVDIEPTSVQSNPMLAALETPIKVAMPPTAEAEQQQQQLRPPAATVCLSVVTADATATVTATTMVTPTERLAVQPITAAPRPVDTKEPQLSGDNGVASDDGSCSSGDDDPYDECTLHRANDRHPHVGYVELQQRSKSAGVRVPPPSAIKIRPLTLQLDSTLVRLSATEPVVMFEFAPPGVPMPAPSSAAAASAKLRPHPTDKKGTRKTGLGEPLQSSTPVTVPQIRVSYKQRTPEHQAAPVASVEPAAPATKRCVF